jgi:hypothetical protein
MDVLLRLKLNNYVTRLIATVAVVKGINNFSEINAVCYLNICVLLVRGHLKMAMDTQFRRCIQTVSSFYLLDSGLESH